MEKLNVPIVGKTTKRVNIDITKHIKTFINYNGEEISREELFNKTKTNNQGKHPTEN